MERLHGTVLAWHAALADLGMYTGCHDGGGAYITMVLMEEKSGLTTRHEGKIRVSNHCTQGPRSPIPEAGEEGGPLT